MTSKNEEKKAGGNFIGITTITVANIGLEKPIIQQIVEKAKGKPIAICRIVGQATKMKSGETQMGEYVKFTGLFAATNYATMAEYRSGQLILPNVCSGTLEGLLGSAQANVDAKGAAAVVFGYEILVKGDPKSAVGYVFAMTSLVQGNDPLAEMMAALPPVPTTKLLA